MVFDPYGYDLSHLPQPEADPLAARALLEVPQQGRRALWYGLTEAVEGTLALWERTVPGVQHTLPDFTVQHTGLPRFNPADLREQSLDNWHRLMGVELRIGAQALEALIVTGNAGRYAPTLAEQCARVGQLSSEMERRANEWVADALLKWELKMLRYRASPVVGPLVYG
jgi:hypothetical protein